MVKKEDRVERLIQEVEKELSDVVKEISNHPYIRDLEAGRIGKDRLGVFVQQQYHIVNCDLRSLALAVAKAKTREAREFLFSSLRVEVEALRHLLVLGEALGLSEDDLRRSELIAAAQAYANYIASLVQYGSEHELTAAFLVDIPVWGGNCVRVGKALERRYGVPSQALKFFEMFSAPPGEEYRKTALGIIGAGLTDEHDVWEVKTACRLVLEYELMFWDAIYKASF
jgi:thiaminase